MPKVLIIEDEQFLAEMYEMKFKQEGYKVIVAENGQDGLRLAEKELPDYVLLDLVMPKMDGYEVLEKIRANKKTKDLKVYILSNLGQAGEVKKGLNEGANGYLVKANLTPSQVVQYIQMVDDDKPNMPTAFNGVKSKKKKKRTKTAGLKGKRILIIEDEDAIIEMYKMRLEKDGYHVEVARNGAWGLKLAGEKKFAIIIMDMVMPAMTGYEMLMNLKDGKVNANTPVLVLSNSAQENDIEKTKKLGVRGFLLKSQITPTKLVGEVKKIIK